MPCLLGGIISLVVKLIKIVDEMADMGAQSHHSKNMLRKFEFTADNVDIGVL